MDERFKNLLNKDNNVAYKSMLELEKDASESNELYSYFDELLRMFDNEKTFVRVRAFILICSLSKWDTENKINKNINTILGELDDPKGAAVRKCLEKINLLLMYKPELSEKVEDKLQSLDLSKYKDSMSPLIKKDIYYILEHLW